MLGVPLMIMGAAKQAVAKKIDKRARGDLKEAMGNVAGAMGGGTGVPAFARTKSSTGPDRRISTAIKNAEKRRRAKRDAKEQEEFNKMYAKSLQEGQPVASGNKTNAPSRPTKKSGPMRIKSDLNVSEIDLSTNTTGGGDNSPNALEVGMKKAKAKKVAEAIDEGDTEKFAESVTKRTMGGQKAFYRMQGFPRQLVGDQKNLPEFLKKEILDAPTIRRYNSETMEMEELKPVNRTALQATGREGDNIPTMRSYGTPYTKRSATGKAKIKKTVYGQTGKAILDKNLIQPVYKKIYKDKNA